MEDFSKTFRKKNKFVFELRYKPYLKLLDEKGKIIDSVHREIEKSYPFWQIVNSDIVFYDNEEVVKNEFVIGLKRMAVLVEDISTYEAFYDNVFRFVKIFYSNIGINSYVRIGFRIISLYESKEKNEYGYYLGKIESKFLKDPIDLGLKHKDLLVRIIHANGFYQIGPVKSDETWVRSSFKDFSDEKLLPKSGIGLDIDGFGTEFDVTKLTDLNKKIESTLTLSKSIEDALLKSLEL
jgi:hypothetical protein